MRKYRAFGSVRGACGHAHRTLAGAHACAARDGRACSSLRGGAYSDRYVQASDGSPLTEAELSALDTIAREASR